MDDETIGRMHYVYTTQGSVHWDVLRDESVFFLVHSLVFIGGASAGICVEEIISNLLETR